MRRANGAELGAAVPTAGLSPVTTCGGEGLYVSARARWGNINTQGFWGQQPPAVADQGVQPQQNHAHVPRVHTLLATR